MRLLLTTDTVGGVWTYTKVLTEGLLKLGHSIALVSFGAEPSPDQRGWASATERAAGNAFRYISSSLPLEWMPENHRAFDEGAALLRQVASSWTPDLLHTNQFCFGQLDLGIPALVAAHSDVLSWADACVPSGLPPSPWLERYIQLVQNGLDRADAVVAPTRWMLGAAAAHFTLPPVQHVIPNGRTLPAPDVAPVRRRQAVTAGRMWDPSKNLSALREITVCPVLVAGTSAQVAPDPPFPQTMRLLGHLAEEDLFQLFRESRIYIAASLYEPFGLAPVEAALCGCAIVANDLASFREVWGTSALYFRTTADLEHHLRSLLEDDAFFAHMQTVSRAQASSFSAESMTVNYLDLYTGLLRALSSARASTAAPCTYVN